LTAFDLVFFGSTWTTSKLSYWSSRNQRNLQALAFYEEENYKLTIGMMLLLLSRDNEQIDQRTETW